MINIYEVIVDTMKYNIIKSSQEKWASWKHTARYVV